MSDSDKEPEMLQCVKYGTQDLIRNINPVYGEEIDHKPPVLIFIEVFHALQDLQKEIDAYWWKISEKNVIGGKIYRATKIIGSQIGFDMHIDAIMNALFCIDELDTAGRYICFSGGDANYDYFVDLVDGGRGSLNKTIHAGMFDEPSDTEPDLAYLALADFLRVQKVPSSAFEKAVRLLPEEPAHLLPSIQSTFYGK